MRLQIPSLVLSCLIHAVAGRTFPAGERGSAAGSLLSSHLLLADLFLVKRATRFFFITHLVSGAAFARGAPKNALFLAGHVFLLGSKTSRDIGGE
jgi:hypothetical protein